MKWKNRIFILVGIFLVSCAPSAVSPVNVTSTIAITAAPVVTETPTFTPSVTPAPTETPTVIPTPTEIAYFDLSSAERLEQSQRLVEQAEGYDGEVSFTIDRWNETKEEPWNNASFWWNPTTQQWGVSEELTTGTAGYPEAEFDKKGNSFCVAAAGWENTDGSLVLIHPTTGEQITLPGTVDLPELENISVRDIMAMSLDELNEYAVNTSVAMIDDPESRISQMQAAMIVKGTSFPGFVIDVNNLFPIPSALGGKELPEMKGDIVEAPTQILAIPIFSPETGDFMLWAIIYRGTFISNLELWTDGDATDFDTVPFTDGVFGNDADNFGIFMEYSSELQPSLPYYRGGGEPTVSSNDLGMGDIYTIRRLLSAKSEAEILSILQEQGMIWSVPSAIVFDHNQ